MVIDWAEPGEDEGASLELTGELGRLEKGRESETLSFHEDALDAGNVGEPEMASIAGKEEGIRVRVERAGLWLEPADEKFVEALEGFRVLREFRGVEPEVPDKGGNELAAGGAGHPVAIPAGKEGSLDKVSQDGASWILVGKAQPAFAVDLFGFEGAGLAIEVANGLHGPTLPLA